ncbi:hypothetical protein Gotur_034903, partial [Gossypium turneri]
CNSCPICFLPRSFDTSPYTAYAEFAGNQRTLLQMALTHDIFPRVQPLLTDCICGDAW